MHYSTLAILALALDAWKNRSRIEIVSKILSTCINGLKKTHIMYKVNISYKQFCEYLEFLEQTALIEPSYDEEGQKIFRTTSKGIEFIKHYEYLNRLVSIPMEFESEIKAEKRMFPSFIDQ